MGPGGRVTADAVEHELTRLVDLSGTSVVMFDTGLNYLTVSEPFLATHGLDRSAVIGRNHYDVFPDIPDRWRQINERVLRGEECRSLLDVFHRADGVERWLRWNMRPWRNANGGIGGAILQDEDLSEARRLREALHSTESALEALFQSTSAGIAFLDADARFERCNPAFGAIAGYSSADFSGMFLGSAVHPDDAAAVIAEIDRVRHGHATRSEATFRLVRKDGSIVVVEQVLTAIGPGSGKQPRLAALLRDVTQRVDMELRLRQSDRLAAIGMLAEAIAHDLGTVVIAFRGAMSGLRHASESMTLPKAALDGIDVVRQGTDYVAHLSDGLRLLTAGASGALDTVDLPEWWRCSSALLRSAIPRGIGLEARLDDIARQARIGAGELTQVVLNLVTNAAQAVRDRGTPVRGRIAIETKPAPGGTHVELSVTDDGVGIAPEDVHRVSDRYVTSRASSGGSGIGLSVVRRLVEERGGSVDFRSSLGVGTTVTIRLPAAAGAPSWSSSAGATSTGSAA